MITNFRMANQNQKRSLNCSRIAILLTLAIGHISVSHVHAEVVYLRPSADTTLLQAFPYNNFGGNEYFNSGTTQNYTKNRGLMKFNVAGVLPPNAKITSVTLTVAVVGEPVDGNNPATFALHRMLRDWGEGTGSGHPPQQSGLGRLAITNEATWGDRFASTTNLWAIEGGEWNIDFSTNVSGETFVYGTDFSPYTFENTTAMVADVQAWLNQPQINFGWLMISQAEESNFGARRFASREDTNRAPVLEVTYFIPLINQITVVSNSVELKFVAEAGHAYTVEYRDTFGPDWLTLTNVSAAMEQTNCVVKDSPSNTQRFYRLMLP